MIIRDTFAILCSSFNEINIFELDIIHLLALPNTTRFIILKLRLYFIIKIPTFSINVANAHNVESNLYFLSTHSEVSMTTAKLNRFEIFTVEIDLDLTVGGEGERKAGPSCLTMSDNEQ